MSTRDDLHNLLASQGTAPTQIARIEQQISVMVEDIGSVTYDEIAQFLLDSIKAHIKNTVTCAFCLQKKQRDECLVMPYSRKVICRACDEADMPRTARDSTEVREEERPLYWPLRRDN